MICNMSSVIFIGSPRHNEKTIGVIDLFIVSPTDIIYRVLRSFVPPVQRFQQVHVDLLGPTLGLLTLLCLVSYTNSMKLSKGSTTPTEFLILYWFFMPLICFSLCKLSRSTITFYELLSLLGYSCYGHILTLLLSYFCDSGDNLVFYILLAFLGGLSTLRLALILLWTITVPAARLLVCTTISVLNILSLIYLYFAYLHKTFLYKGTSR